MDTIRFHLKNGDIVYIEQSNVDFEELAKADYNAKAFIFDKHVIMVDEIVWIEKVE